jgi:multidrug efflux pump subunit AcrA (membrane-fusion protein)
MIAAVKRISLPRLKRNWHNWALGTLCLAVAVFAIASIGSAASGSAATQQTATVSRGVVQSTVSGSGNLEAAKQVELNFGASGEVTAIDVKAGQHVNKGQVLARIDSSSAEASLAAAEAQLSEAEESLEGAVEASWNSSTAAGTTLLVSYEEGSTAAAGEVAAGTEAPATATEAPATEAPTGKSGGESKSATGGETNSPQGSETAPAASGSPGAASASPGAESSSGGAGASSPSSSSSGVSAATAEARLREAELAVKSAQQEVRETTLRAPIAGSVASVSGAVGETISGGSSGASEPSASGSATGAAEGAGGGGSGGSSESAFIVLSQLGTMKMQVSFSESDVNKLKVGQPATVTISSMEEAELAGRVTNVDLLPSEGGSGVVEYPATILLTQSEEGLRAGMSATAEVVVEQVENAISVPSEAISSLGPRKTVTVKEANGTESQRTVTTGLVGDETTQILSGVKPGETLVLPEAKVPTATGAAGAEGAAGKTFPGGGAGFFGGGGGPPAFLRGG